MRSLERHECDDCRAFQIVGAGDHGRFRHCFMRYQRAFNLRRTEPVTADIDHIVDASHDPEVTILVASGAVSGEINTFELRPVLLPVTLVISPNRPQDRRPGPPDNEIAAFVGAHLLPLASYDISFDPGKRFCGRAGLCRSRPRKRADHDSAGFGLPPRVNNRTPSLADDLSIPHPRFWIDGFADCAQQAQTRQVMFQRPVFTPLNKSAYCCRCSVENINSMALNDGPKAIWFRMIRRSFIHQHRGAI